MQSMHHSLSTTVAAESDSPTTVTSCTLHTIHESLIRPVLFIGVAPGLAIAEVSTAFALVFLVGLHLITVGLIAMYIAVIHPLAVWATTQDPQMPAVYLRSLSVHDYYLPHATPFTRTPRVGLSIPRPH
jgi:type IV secretory pathway TrbD component